MATSKQYNMAQGKAMTPNIVKSCQAKINSPPGYRNGKTSEIAKYRALFGPENISYSIARSRSRYDTFDLLKLKKMLCLSCLAFNFLAVCVKLRKIHLGDKTVFVLGLSFYPSFSQDSSHSSLATLGR